MPSPELWIARLRRRLFVGELLHVAAGWLGGFLIAFGLLALGTKLFAPRWWPDMLWTGLALVPLLGYVAWRASQRMPSDREAVALLDKRLGGGGLLMTLAERPDAAWSARLPGAESAWKAALPRLRPARFARTLAVPALFAVGAGFVPARQEPPPAPQVSAGTDVARELAETFELLEKNDAIDQETKESLKEEIDRLADEAEDKPLTHEKWETVDALRERLRSGLDTTELTVSKGRSAAAALAAALGAGEPLTSERSEQLSADLEEALETLRKNGAFQPGEGSQAGLSSELQRLFKNGDFKLPSDAAARKKTLDSLQKLLDAEEKRLSECRGQCQGCLGGQCKPGMGRNAGEVLSGLPGRGGLSRGRGDAELTFGDESDETAVKFKETVLPPGFLDAPNDQTVGVTGSAPEADPTAADAPGAARDSSPATGKATWDRPLRPRHREVVRGYFGEEAK